MSSTLLEHKALGQSRERFPTMVNREWEREGRDKSKECPPRAGNSIAHEDDDGHGDIVISARLEGASHRLESQDITFAQHVGGDMLVRSKKWQGQNKGNGMAASHQPTTCSGKPQSGNIRHQEDPALRHRRDETQTSCRLSEEARACQTAKPHLASLHHRQTTRERKKGRPIAKIIPGERRLHESPAGRGLCSMRSCYSRPIQRHHESLQTLMA